jgi:hypothetical protein
LGQTLRRTKQEPTNQIKKGTTSLQVMRRPNSLQPHFKGKSTMTLPFLTESERRKLAAWNKAHPVVGYEPVKYRKDRFGAWIAYDEHGKVTMYGWEIDHVWPLSQGGLLASQNEVATHWKHNRAKSDNFVG